VVLRRNDDAQMRRATDPKLSANLTAPLVINMRERRGMQQIIARMGCEVTFRPAQ
jgi:flagellar assembly factor FliW